MAQKGFDDTYGARPLRRAIQTYIEDVLAVGFIKNEIKEIMWNHVAIVRDEEGLLKAQDELNKEK